VILLDSIGNVLFYSNVSHPLYVNPAIKSTLFEHLRDHFMMHSPLTLVIGNKTYSSWSLRPWLFLKQMGVEFQEIRVPLYADSSAT
jgi:hypothetical protein